MDKEGSKNGKVANAWTHWRPSVFPALALMAVGIFPGMLKGLYEPYTDKLIVAYVSFGILFIAAIFGVLAIVGYRDISTRYQKIIRLAPSTQPVRGTEGAMPEEAEEDQFYKR